MFEVVLLVYRLPLSFGLTFSCQTCQHPQLPQQLVDRYLLQQLVIPQFVAQLSWVWPVAASSEGAVLAAVLGQDLTGTPLFVLFAR